MPTSACLTLRNRLDPPADNISLLIGAQANRERRRSAQLSPTLHEPVHKRLPHLFAGGSEPANEAEHVNEDGDDHSEETEEEPSPGFLGRVNSYSRLMHTHTKAQMKSPTGTIPQYTRTMHAFTLNQLSHHHQKSKSETSSPHVGTRHALLPSKLCLELSKLSLDELPHGPSNTPEGDHGKPDEGIIEGIDFGKLRRRSLTEPSLRDFAVVKARDFAG